MKNGIIIGLFLIGSVAIAQKPHRVVIQFTDSDSLSQASVMGQVKNIRTEWPEAQIEVVCHGPGLDLLISKNTKAALSALSDWKSKGVVFAACNNTMRRRGVKPEDLIREATVVSSAMTQLVLRQEAGWSYVKGGQ